MDYFRDGPTLSELSEAGKERLNHLHLMEYEEPQFKLSEVCAIIRNVCDFSPKDIQNLTARGFLKPRQTALKKTYYYSLQNCIQAAVIGYLSYIHSLPVAHSIALGTAHRAGCLIAEGFDFLAESEAGNLAVYYYVVAGDENHGVHLSREHLARIILGEERIGIKGVSTLIFEADRFICHVLAGYIEYVLHPAPKRKPKK